MIHKEKMQKLQREMKEKIQSARGDKGIILTLTGDGKGKSSSALGMTLRSSGYNMKVLFVQFIKGKWITGEQKVLESGVFPNVDYIAMGAGFTWDTQNKEEDTERALQLWSTAMEKIHSSSYDMVVFDELNVALNFEYVPISEVIDFLKHKRHDLHVVITGRNAPEEIVNISDTVSVIQSSKHAFDSGIRAQKGIEF